MTLNALTTRLLVLLLKVRSIFVRQPEDPSERSSQTDDEGLFRALIENASDFITILDRYGTIVYESPSVMRFLGYTSNDLLGKVVFEFVHPDDLPGMLETFRQGIAIDGYTAHLECRFRHRNGSWRTLEVTGKNMLHDLRVSGVVVNSRDITEKKRAEREKEIFSDAIESISECVAIVNLDGTILFVNAATLRTYGYGRLELLGKPVSALLARTTPASVLDEIRERTMAGEWHGEVQTARHDGKTLSVHLSTSVIRDEDGVGVAYMGIATDLSERKRVEEEERRRMSRIIRHQKGLLELGTLDASDFPLMRERTLATAMDILEVGRVSYWSFAEDRSEIVCDLLLTNPPRPPAPELRLALASNPKYFEALEAGRTLSIQSARTDPRTSAFGPGYLLPNDIMSMLDVPVRHHGRVVGILCHEQLGTARAWSIEDEEFAASMADMLSLSLEASERLRAEEDLRKALSLLTATLESTADGILVVDESGTIISYNTKFMTMWGIPKEILDAGDDAAALDFVLQQLKHPDRFIAKVRSLYEEKDAESYDVLEFKDGRIFERYSQPQKVGGRSAGRVWSFRDITDRHTATIALQESEEKYRALFNNVLDGVYRSTPDGRLITANPAFVQMLGYASEEEIRTLSIAADLYVDSEARTRWMKDLEKHGVLRNTEVVLTRKDGTLLIGLENAHAVRDATGKTLFYEGSVTDITERKRAEEALRLEKERYREFFEDDLTGDFISTVDGRILSCNTAFARIFGYTSVEEVLSVHAESFYQNKEAREEFLNLVRQNRKLENVELVARRRDGRPVHVIENIIGEFDADGALVRLKGYLFDITERKRLEEEFRQAHKMESIGTLAGGVAHDFNNILSIIMAYASRLSHDPSPDAVGRATESILKASERGAGLVRQLLTIARRAESHFEAVDVNDVVGELATLLRETFPRTITFHVSLTKDLPSLVADKNQLNQALLNLCVNARDAMPSGGSITISTGMERGEDLHGEIRDITAAQLVRLTVSDTGEGIDEATQQRIFEPFFTTKGHGKGTGLGLAVVYGVVKAHGGWIRLQSRKGFGTSFHIYLPVSESRGTGPRTEAPGMMETASGTETLLFVEDEDVLREEVSRNLREKGYTVVTASDGLSAVDLYRQQHRSIDLVIMDMGLPKLGGWDALQMMRAVDPGLKAIVASGYFHPELKPAMVQAGITNFVQKPYYPAEILRLIRTVLSRTTA